MIWIKLAYVGYIVAFGQLDLDQGQPAKHRLRYDPSSGPALAQRK